MTTPTNEQRAAFEAWYCREVSGCNGEWVERMNGDGDYLESPTQKAWLGWCAALAAPRAGVLVPEAELAALREDAERMAEIARVGVLHGLRLQLDKMRGPYALACVISALRDNGMYTDEEGEDTTALSDLLTWLDALDAARGKP